jgi:hypothetical protein
MRTLLAAALLAVAALAAAPPASAAEATALPVCVPPGVGSLAVCAGSIGGDPCVWAWVGLSYRSVCVDDEGRDLVVCSNSSCQSVRDVLATLIAQPDPVCVPPGVESFGVCAGLVDGDLCAWVWLGPSSTGLCLDDEGPDILLCDNSGCHSILRVSDADGLLA